MPDPSAAAGPDSDGVLPETDATADATTADATTADATTADATTDDTEAADAPGFMNRAARRAHAQGSTPQRAADTVGKFGRKGTVQGPRQWGNRRSG